MSNPENKPFTIGDFWKALAAFVFAAWLFKNFCQLIAG